VPSDTSGSDWSSPTSRRPSTTRRDGHRWETQELEYSYRTADRVYYPQDRGDTRYEPEAYEVSPRRSAAPVGGRREPMRPETRPLPRPPRQKPHGTPLGLKLAMIAMAVALLGTGGGLIFAWSQGDPTPKPRDTALQAIEDTFYVQEEPAVDRSGAQELLAANSPSRQAVTYLKFDVPPLAQPGHIDSARLETTSNAPQPAGVQLFRVADTTWTASEFADSGPPAHASLVTTSPTSAGSTSLLFDLTPVIAAAGTYAFAIVSPRGDRQVSMFSSEHGDDGPRLVVTWTPDAPRDDRVPQAMQQPGAGPSGIPSLDPSAEASFGRSPSAGTTTVPLPPLGANRTLAGATVSLRSGETFAQGVARADRTYGPLKMVRVFYPGLPPSWPGSRADVSNRTVVVSFKALPRDILAGKHDSLFRNWFASVPENMDTYWVYYHEPEDNIEAGDFTAADYRAAWRRLAGFADQANNPRLYATLVLMCWSLSSNSHRNWRDFYPGDDIIHTMGWDCYNYGWKKGTYDDPAGLFGKSIELSRQLGKPYGYAETGSQMASGDNGTRRGAWLRQVADYMRAQKVAWAAYFDSTVGGEFRLLDTPSQLGWQYFCRG